jgi:hypothetical protein
VRRVECVVICDDCGFTTEPEATLAAARAQARALRWRVAGSKGGTDQCDECAVPVSGSLGAMPPGLRERLATIGSGRCWCGAALGHDWPGRDAGAPHPR